MLVSLGIRSMTNLTTSHATRKYTKDHYQLPLQKGTDTPNSPASYSPSNLLRILRIAIRTIPSQPSPKSTSRLPMTSVGSLSYPQLTSTCRTSATACQCVVTSAVALAPEPGREKPRRMNSRGSSSNYSISYSVEGRMSDRQNGVRL